ncbi:MAG: YifB family Mg chelatase-like AAA ATPase [Pseudomonadales bacterium]|nr:YifB family Mg chelatase-like AAA ATPase [Pseudomonadales bacterium]
MALAITFSRATHGIKAPLVRVETHLSNGLPAFTIVGLPEVAVKESRDRVRSAIINSHFDFPDRRITINLAPADLPKEGSRFDLAIALGILAASGQLPCEPLARYEFIGELSLSGELRYVRGLLPALVYADEGRALFVPSANHHEACLPVNTIALAAKHILDVCAHLRGKAMIEPVKKLDTKMQRSTDPDLADVCGQPLARRALEIAAAGGHNLLLSGPPGTGKTMLASRINSLLPPLQQQAAIEVAALHSLAGKRIDARNWHQRPFRCPHHSATAPSIVGGGSNPRPGEISLAHHGVLFLDELPEFDRSVLEVLRQPLESGRVSICRAAQQVEYPAEFQLIAAMNPCPCGYYGDPRQQCGCSAAQLQRYRSKLSGPLLDRIDLQVHVSRLPASLLLQRDRAGQAVERGESSAVVRARVEAAQNTQHKLRGKLNASLSPAELTSAQWIEPEAIDWLAGAIEKLGQSARAFHRMLRVARTIADLQAANQAPAGDATKVGIDHVREALMFRPSNDR